MLIETWDLPQLRGRPQPVPATLPMATLPMTAPPLALAPAPAAAGAAGASWQAAARVAAAQAAAQRLIEHQAREEQEALTRQLAYLQQQQQAAAQAAQHAQRAQQHAAQAQQVLLLQQQGAPAPASSPQPPALEMPVAPHEAEALLLHVPTLQALSGAMVWVELRASELWLCVSGAPQHVQSAATLVARLLAGAA